MNEESPSSLNDVPSFLGASNSTSTVTTSPPPRLTIPSHHGQQDGGALGQQPPNLNLTPSESSNTQRFRTNYDMLLKEVLEEEDDSSNDGLNDSTLMNSDLSMYTNLHPFQQLDSIDIDLDAATADLPDELRAALEDRSLADKYLANLKTFMSHQRSQSMGSMTSGKGDYSSPTTPLQPTFSIQSPSAAHHHPSTSSSSAYYHHRMQQDPLYKVLDAVPYQTRLINGVQSLWELRKKLAALKIPELDLPSVSDAVIKARLNDLYKVQDDLFIHLHGGPLVRNTHRLPIGAKKKHEIDRLLDQVAKEIGLYEEFVKRDDYLSLESILNESDTSDEEDRDSEINDTESTSLSHIDSPAMATNTMKSGHPSPTMATLSHTVYDPQVSSSPPTLKKPSTLRRVTSQPTITHTSFLASSTPPPLISNSSSHSVRRYDASSSSTSVGGPGSIHSYDAVSDPSLSQLLATDDDDERQGNEKQDEIISEAFKWTPLVKISDHLYSKDVRRTSGLVSVLAVSGVIAVGTTRSLVYVYDYSQNLKCVLGDTVRAVEIGAVTAVAISADHTTIVCGHSQGHLIIWDIRKPQHPIRTIEPIPPNQTLGTTTLTTTTTTTPPPPPGPTANQAGSSRKEGHVRGTAILHVGFIGIKKSEIVSGDDQGMAFYHVLYKVVMVNAVDTTRILGRYQNLSLPSSPSSSTSTTAAATAASQPSLARVGSSSSLLDSGTAPFNKPRRPSTVFAMQALPLGQFAHPAENFGLVALLTPYKMIIVGLKPSCQTKFKFLKPKLMLPTPMEQQPSGDENHPHHHPLKSDMHENLSGCLAWLPVTKATGPVSADKRLHKEPALEDPMLAYAWGNHLFIMRVGVGMADPPPSLQYSPSRFRSPMGGGSSGGKRGTKLSFPKPAECLLEDPIIGLQWINRQILVLFTPNEEMLLFDPKAMVVTERASVRNKQLVYHDWFNAPLRDLTAPTSMTIGVVVTPNELDMGAATNTTITTTTKIVEMAYYHSLKGYKGKLFLLGLDQIYVGTLLSWADRILALVRAGDFLDAIQLCTAFYNGKWTQTVVGLPAGEPQRKQLVGEKLMELLVASLNYAFSPTRRSMLIEEQQTEMNAPQLQLPDRVEATTDTTTAAVLYQDLAKCCVDACLSMGDTVFLFETAYEQFADHGVQGFFLQVLESYIVTDQLRDLPPAVMKDLVTHYSSAPSRLAALERIIWHVQPQCLDIDQIVGVCQREGLYEAMMYVWNKSMDDFVSPLVEMLKVIRQCLKNEGEPVDGAITVIRQQQQQQRLQAEKVFDYLMMVLQGRTFPEGTLMRTSRGNEARSAVYSFVFSGRCVVWPRVGGKLILTVDENEAMAEPTYPYLRLLLRFNTKRFLDALESAFEDPWLNGGDDMLTSTFEEDVLQGKVISRQIIVNTLLDVMGGSGMNNSNNNNNNNNNAHLLAMPRLNPSFSASTVHSGVNGNNVKGSGTSSETTSSYYDGGSSGDSNSQNAAAAAAAAQNNHLLQLYIFIASNLHKYTTFILLPLTTKQKILSQLTMNDMVGYYYYSPKQPQQPHHHHHHRRYANDENTKEERQRAVQQLLTVYTPNNEEAMTSLYEEAKFWNVLEDVYRRDKRYGKLVETYLKDTTPPSTRLHSSPATEGRHGNDDVDDDLDDEEAITLARQHRVFNCVDWILDASSPLTDHQRQEVKRVVLIRISQFVDMDGQRTADLIQKYFGADHHDILRRLDEDEEFDDDDNDDEDYNGGVLEDGICQDGDHGGKDESRFPVTFARVADKRIFSYLRGLLEPQPSSSTTGGMERSTVLNGYSNTNGTIPEEEEHDDDDDEYVILNGGDDDVKNNIHSTPSTHVIRRTNIDIKLQERYIDLMCRFDPSGVYDYLNTKLFDYDVDQQRQKEDGVKSSDALTEHHHHQHYTTDGFEHVNFDTLLKSCDKYGVMDAAVWIMEKMGNIQGALEKMLEVGKEKIQMILAIIKQQPQPWMFEDQSKISNGLIGLSGVLRVGIRLCENSSTYHSNNKDNNYGDDDDDEIESLWFRLLDVYVEASMEIHSALKKQQQQQQQQQVCDDDVPVVGVQQHVIASFKSFVQSILTSLLLSTSPQVSLPRLLLRLIDSQTKGETTFADFRDIFLSMLDTYKYEGQLLALTNRLFDRDLFLGVQDMVRRRGKGWRPQTMACTSCGIGILDLSLMQPRLWEQEEDAQQVMVFHCGHAFHRHCLDQVGLCTLCSALDKGKSKAITS